MTEDNARRPGSQKRIGLSADVVSEGTSKSSFDIFLCYRRVASEMNAEFLYGKLFEAFGQTVFIDHQCLRGGQPWRERIDEVLGAAAIIVVLLEPKWEEEIERRNDSPASDQVVREVCVALDHGIPLLAIYVGQAKSASSTIVERFPDGTDPNRVLHTLSNAQSLRWRGASSDADMLRIIKELTDYLPRFGMRLRERCRARLDAQLAGKFESGAWQEKFRSLSSAVARTELETELSGFFQQGSPLIIIHAEEGMGKTVVLGRMLQHYSDRSVLLSEACDPAWRRGFDSGVRQLLTAGTRHPDDTGEAAAGVRKLITTAELELAIGEPLLVVIDGLNEGHGVGWAELLNEALSQIEYGRPWQIVVTLRTQRWEQQIRPDLDDPKRISKVLAVPPMKDNECCALAEHLGFPWLALQDSKLKEQLRRPRMLVAASSIPAEQLEGLELTYPLLMLLDLKNSESRYKQLKMLDFSTVLQRLGRGAAKKASLTRQVLQDSLPGLLGDRFDRGLEELCDAGVIRRDGAQLAVHEDAVLIAIGLHLVAVLRDIQSLGHDALVERIATEMADRQDDSSGQTISHAIMVALLERISEAIPPLDQHDPVLAALFADWERRYNKSYEPERLARWLLPELLWLAEHGSHGNDIAKLITESASANLLSPWRTEFLARLNTWFMQIDLDAESYSGPANPDRVAKRMQRFEQSRGLANLTVMERGEPQLRRFGLDMAARAQLDPKELKLVDLIISVAVQPANAWGPLEHWVRTSPYDWWAVLQPVWERLARPDVGIELRVFVGELFNALWPTPDCFAHIAPTPRTEGDTPSYVNLNDLRFLVATDECPSENQLELLDRRTDPSRTESRSIRGEVGPLALWMPDRLEELIEIWVTEALTADPAPNGFIGSTIFRFAPLLKPNQALRLRKALARGLKLENVQLSRLSLASWWNLAPARQALAVARHQAVLDLSSDELRATRIDRGLAMALLRRIKLNPAGPASAGIAHWLFRALTKTNCDDVRSALTEQLPQIPLVNLSEAAQFWLLRLAIALDAEQSAGHLIPVDWRYEQDTHDFVKIQWARSVVLARQASIEIDEVRKRCNPDHCHLALEDAKAEEIYFSRLIDELTSTEFNPWASNNNSSDLRAAVLRRPDVVDGVLDSLDDYRHERAALLAEALTPADHPRWIELVESMLASVQFVRRTENDIDERYLIAFKAPDDERARQIWSRLLNAVEHDADLLQLIVAACKGQGQAWLQSHSVFDPAALPHHQLRAATIAGMIGDLSQRDVIESACESYGGWIAKGFERAIELYRSDELAQAWYRRFRSADNWYEAYGSWRMHCECLDLRHQLWDRVSMPPYSLRDAERYEAAFRGDVQHACQQRRDQMRKTRFGMDC